MFHSSACLIFDIDNFFLLVTLVYIMYKHIYPEYYISFLINVNFLAPKNLPFEFLNFLFFFKFLSKIEPDLVALLHKKK